MAQMVGPFRPANQNKMPITQTLGTRNVRRTGPGNPTTFTPPRPSGLITRKTGKTVIGVAKNTARAPLASRVAGAVTAGSARSVNSATPRR